MEESPRSDSTRESRKQHQKGRGPFTKKQLMVGGGLALLLVLVLLFVFTPLGDRFKAPATLPEISLQLMDDPQILENGQWQFTVQALVSGNPIPEVIFNRDDSLGEAGESHAVILLSLGETFTLTAVARNSQGEDESSLELRAEMTTATMGTIEGHLVYPSDHIPDMRIVAEDADSGLQFYTTEIIEDSQYTTGVGFVLRVPPGRYYVYAIKDGDDYKAYHDRYVQSGFTEDSFERIVVEVQAAQHLKNVTVGNWWGPAPNRDPVIAGLTIPEWMIAGESYAMLVQASDPDGDPLSYSWAITGPGSANMANPQANPLQWSPAVSGEYAVQVTVRDNRGGESVYSTTVSVVMEAVKKPVAAETGFVIKDHMANLAAGIYAGDFSNNRTCRGFISFDIGEISGTVKKVELILSQPRVEGSPAFMHGTLGLWVGVVDWGGRPLTVADYNLTGTGIQAFTEYDIAIVSIPGESDVKLANELQKKMNEGKTRFQIRLHFAQESTNNDNSLDGVAYQMDNVTLKIYFTE